MKQACTDEEVIIKRTPSSTLGHTPSSTLNHTPSSTFGHTKTLTKNPTQ